MARQDDSPSEIDQKLLGAIERLLGRGQRFAAISVAQISREAGVGRATFYLHYKDKAELVHRLMRRLTDEVVENAGSWFEGGRVDADSMKAALLGIVSTFKRHAAILSAVSDTAAQDEAVAAAHQAMMQSLCQLSRKAIERARRQGTAAEGADAALADLLTLSIEAYCARHIHQFDGRRLELLVARIQHVCGRAIFADYPG